LLDLSSHLLKILNPLALDSMSGSTPCDLCGFVPDDLATIKAGIAALEAKKETADKGAATIDTGSLKVKSWFKTVDGNGLALSGFAFSTFMFFAFLCDIDEVGLRSNGTPDKKFGIHFLCSMLTWGVSLVLVIAGLAQGIQGDHLGFTSYIFHAGILGSIGYQFKDVLDGNNGYLYLVGYFCIVAGWFDLIFTIMAFRAATMFGILYFTVAVMFILVGLNFTQKLSDVQEDPTNVSGDRIAGISCLVVTVQCCGLLWPVLTGCGAGIFKLPNPIGKCLGPAPGAGAEEAEEGVIEHQTKIKLVDANGLALMAFGFSTFQFAMFLLNVDGINWGDDGHHTERGRPSIHNLEGMLIWGVAACLTIAGIFQFFNGDTLGFTSYIFHAGILGTTGWWLDDALNGFGGPSLGIWSFFYYFAFWVNMVFTLMAFRIAKMFGLLYFTVGVMFLIVGLNWANHLDDSCDTPDNPSGCKATGEHLGDYLAGICCLVVACQCFYLLIPVMTGKGIIF
jgi:hypothetical protein